MAFHAASQCPRKIKATAVKDKIYTFILHTFPCTFSRFLSFTAFDFHSTLRARFLIYREITILISLSCLVLRTLSLDLESQSLPPITTLEAQSNTPISLTLTIKIFQHSIYIMTNDTATTRLLFAILSQKCLKDVCQISATTTSLLIIFTDQLA